MKTSFERIDAARDDALESSGPDFLRRLIDYCRLLEEDAEIRTAVDGIRREVGEARAGLAQEDDAFVAELVPIRRELVVREPDADDSDASRPETFDPADQQQADQWHSWIWTLANFDAIAEDRPGKIIEEQGLDRSRARMLVSILNAQLHDLVFPFNEQPAPRPDLMDLYDRMSAIGRRQVAAYRAVEKLSDETGYLALLHIEHVAAKANPDPRQLETSEERREFAEEALTSPDLMRLPEILRPKEARGSLGIREILALERVEKACRGELERLHRPLRKRLGEGSVGWRSAVVARIKHVPTWVATLASIITVLIGGAAIIKFAFGLF